MKTQDAQLIARAGARAQCLAWLLELHHGDWTWRVATQTATFGGTLWPTGLGRLTSFREWLPADPAGGCVRASATIDVPESPDAAGSLRAELATRPPHEIAATLRLAWLDVGGTDDARAAVVLHGRLAGWETNAAGLHLELTDVLSALAARPLARILRADMGEAIDSPAVGRPLPWIFGRVADAELVPLRVGRTTRLAAPITTAQGVIPVLDTSGFPPTGLVQIGPEIILYQAIDHAACTLGTAQRPVVRGDGAAARDRGETVRQLPPGGCVWLIADHACHAVGTPLADGLPLTGDPWTLELAVLGGEIVQTVRLERWPVDAAGREARRLSAPVEGLEDATGDLIENPAAVLRTLLTHERLGALAPDELDAAAFAQAADDFDARGYRFARRIAGAATLGELINSAAAEAGLWIRPTLPVRLTVVRAQPHAEDAVAVLDDAVRIARPASTLSVDGSAPSDAIVLMRAAKDSGETRVLRFPPERHFDGTRPLRRVVHWLAPEAADAMADFGVRLWLRLAHRDIVHVQHALSGSALLDCGDVVRVDDPGNDFTDAPLWVSEIAAGRAAGSPARVRVTTRRPRQGEEEIISQR